MASTKWDSPMDSKKEGKEPFPGETSGPGVYNNNPLLSKPTSGGFQMKFLETVKRGESLTVDTPMDAMNGIPKTPNLTPPAHQASDNVGAKWDTPFKPVKK
jgi:hypothetical protein